MGNKDLVLVIIIIIQQKIFKRKIVEQSNKQINNEDIENTIQLNNIINCPFDYKKFIKNKITYKKEKY